MQGDIVALYSANGTLLVTYSYTAWGQTFYTPNGAPSQAIYNPFRYRGYYFDKDLDIYYLNSRYYDQYVGRFISPDAYVSTGQGFVGHNMYAYCNNNPVMLVDRTGNFAIPIAAVLLGSLVLSGLAVLAYDATHDQVTAKATAGVIEGLKTEAQAREKRVIMLGKVIEHLVKNREKEAAITDTPQLSKTYYHSTTQENALSIMSTGIMKGSEWEGGYVFAWRNIPSRYALKNSGAHEGVVISFETNAVFFDDVGITDPRVKQYGPIMTQGPIVVWNVKIVE